MTEDPRKWKIASSRIWLKNVTYGGWQLPKELLLGNTVGREIGSLGLLGPITSSMEFSVLYNLGKTESLYTSCVLPKTVVHGVVKRLVASKTTQRFCVREETNLNPAQFTQGSRVPRTRAQPEVRCNLGYNLVSLIAVMAQSCMSDMSPV